MMKIIAIQLKPEVLAVIILKAFIQSEPPQGITDEQAFTHLDEDLKQKVLRAAYASIEYFSKAMSRSGLETTTLHVPGNDDGRKIKH